MALGILHQVRQGAIVAAALLTQCAFSASVTVSLSAAKGICKGIDLPRWPPPAAPLPPNSYDWEHLVSGVPLSADLDLRAGDGGVLIGLFAVPGLAKKGPPIYSPAKYEIDFARGKGKKAAESQWEAADTYLVYRDSTYSTVRATKPEDKLVYKGREFARRGADWPLGQDDVARLSPDGGFLSVYGWDGTRGGNEGLNIFGKYVKADGNYYVDIYNVSSGARLVSLSGRFHDVSPDDMFRESAWFSRRYYVLPLEPRRMNRLVLCDVQAAGKAKP